MTNEELRDAAVEVLKKTWYGYRVYPHSPKWNTAMGLLAQITDSAPPPPPPPPPPPVSAYAPRAYNSTPSADARFCMDSQYGVRPDGGGYIDQMGIRYDEAGRDLGGRTTTIVPGLKGANSMDGKEPCEPYTNEGRTFPPYPAESFER